MKYSINGTGNIVAERDIYSLGGFIPKGRVGGKIASKAQLSQDGDCWLAGGDISGRPDVRIKDNAFVGTFTPGAEAVHTDGVTEFSGNTLIPGNIWVRSLATETKNNVFIKDSFIGVSMDVLCGPSTTATAFPFGQGDFKAEAAKGALFASASMRLENVSACRSTTTLQLGRNTYLYIPTGYRARVFWAYYDTSNQLAYSGESTAVAAGLTKLDHSVYRLAMVSIVKADGTAMTPANLLATGAKILGHISGSLLMDLRPESASGQYVMDKSSFIMNTDNFGLTTTQRRFLAGGMYDTNMYTKTDRPDYKLYGTFRNVERLEYTKYISDSYRTAATRDTYISAYDCPLLRVDDNTFDDSLAGKGDLVLRNCIVPKAWFAHDPIDGNTYDGIDFSYANEDIGFPITGYAVFYSSNKQGLYRVKAGVDITQGLVSHKGNLEASARLYPNPDSIPLDGNIIEQGAYYGEPVHYEADKHDHPSRVRTKFPLPTRGATFPELPAGFGARMIVYLDDDFVCKLKVTDPTTMENTYPYYVMMFTRDDLTALSAKDFIALGLSLSMTNYGKVPEVTGSAYVGAGVTVCGDVKLIGDPYVNRVFDLNVWERGGCQPTQGGKWQDGFFSSNAHNRYRSKDLIPVEPGGTVSRTAGGKMVAWYFDEFGNRTSSGGTGWVTSFVVPAGAYFVGIVLDVNGDGLVIDSDISVANVKYVRAFKKRRYITNELDRTSPEDTLLGPDMWEQGYLQGGDSFAGKTYEELKSESPNSLRTKRPINASTSPVATLPSGFSRNVRSLDASTKLLSMQDLATNKEALSGIRVQKDPASPITPADVAAARIVIEFTPSPRIIVPYGSATLFISGPKIRMYDNAVLSRNLNQEGEIVLQGDAVMGYDFNAGSCMCSNGHSDAIIKLP